MLTSTFDNDDDGSAKLDALINDIAATFLDYDDLVATYEAAQKTWQRKSEEQRNEQDRQRRIAIELEEAQHDHNMRATAYRRLHLVPNPALNYSQPTPPSATIKIPKLTLPTFDGNPLKWTEFWDSYSVAIHDNTSLTHSQKFTYLRAQLSGNASKMVSGYAITDANYETAIQSLVERYGSDKLLVHRYAQALSHLHPSDTQTGNLRTLYDLIERNLRSLDALGRPIEHDMILSTILSKLPPEVIIQLQNSNPDSIDSITALRQALSKLILAREYAENLRSTIPSAPFSTNIPSRISSFAPTFTPRPQMSAQPFQSKPPIQFSHPQFSRPQFSHPQTTHFNAYDSPVAPPKSKSLNSPCAFFSGPHFPDACSRVTSLLDRRRLITGRLCDICLSSRHSQAQCQSSKPCFYCKQVRNHHSSLCPQKFSSSTSPKRPNESAHPALDFSPHPALDFPSTYPTHNCPTFAPYGNPSNPSYVSPEPNTKILPKNSLLATGQQVLMQTATTTIIDPSRKKTFTARILFDTGASRSYISTKAARALRLSPQFTETLQVHTFGSRQPMTITTDAIHLFLQTQDRSLFLITAHIQKTISGPIHRFADHYKRIAPLLHKFNLTDPIPYKDEVFEFDILIGSLFVIESKLGHILNGQIPADPRVPHHPVALCFKAISHSHSKKSPTFLPDYSHAPWIEIKALWELETIGIKDQPHKDDGQEVLNRFTRTTQFKDNRYQVEWPWKDPDTRPFDNYYLSLGRLKSVLHRLPPDILKNYDAIFRDQESKGIIEKVITPGKSTKVRIVFDGSAKTRPSNASLNECLYAGPSLLENLAGLLLRFSTHKIGIVSDIEKAFLQIALSNNSRDVTRFLWFKNPSLPPDSHNLVIYRFACVPFGVISSPFLLNASIQLHLKQYPTDIASKISPNIYVDNVITGFPDITSATQFYNDAKSLFATASMNLREWNTNLPNVLQVIPDVNHAKPNPKVLGLRWNTTTDTLSITFPSSQSLSQSLLTQRHVLSHIHKFFDPLGLFSPILVQAKLFLQEITQQDLHWDTPLSSTDSQQWSVIQATLQPATSPEFPRWIGTPTESSPFQIHCFCDASHFAYAACVYLTFNNAQSIPVLALVFAKTRIKPPKEISIPRLELLALHIGSQITSFIRKELHTNDTSIHLWSDSQCALRWLISPPPSDTFVKRRVATILSLPQCEFHYVPNDSNPADIASRGTDITSLSQTSLWWEGPSWLKKSNSWPQLPFDMTPSFPAQNDFPIFTMPVTLSEHSPLPDRLNPSNFSTLPCLLCVTAWTLRFIHNLQALRSQRTPRRFATLSASEINFAQDFWLKHVQARSFSAELNSLKRNQRTFHGNLPLFLDAKYIIRCEGRIDNADLDPNTVSPILLPKNDPFTSLVMLNAHQIHHHTGVSTTLANLHTRYWIPSGRRSIFKVIHNCPACQRHDSRPLKRSPHASTASRTCTSMSPFSTHWS